MWLVLRDTVSLRLRQSAENTKCTLLLQSALGGSGKTIFIINISPSPDLYSETLNSLQYATKAQKVKQLAARGERESYEAILREKCDEIRELKMAIELLKKENAELLRREKQFLSYSKPLNSLQEEVEKEEINEMEVKETDVFELTSSSDENSENGNI